MTTPQAHGDFDGSIMSYLDFFPARFWLMGGLSPRPFPLRYRALFYLNFVSYKIAATYVGLMLRKKNAFRFSTALSESSSLCDILPFRSSISGRTCLFAANSVSVGLPGKFEKLDNPSSVSDFIENNFLEDFNSFILFIILSWFACRGHLVTWNFFKISTLWKFVFGGNA